MTSPILLALLICAAQDSIPVQDSIPAQDSIPVQDSIRTDTLAEVVVQGGPSPMSKAIGTRIEEWKKQKHKHYNITTLLNMIHPDLNDIIMHPFGFEQRKKERRRRKTKKILEHYDQVKTPDEQLREAIEKEKQRALEEGR